MSFHPLLLASGTLIRIAQFLLSLSLLIALHEGGHFFFARLFKTRVEKFYLFFDFLFPFPGLLNFSLFKKKVGDTEYGLGWFPLGGYVKIAGMVDESMDKEALAKPPQPWEFRSKPAWQRLFIMLGGIIVNVLTAFVIYSFVLWIWGERHLPISEANKGGIEIVDSVGYKIGFKDGDKIVSLDGKQFPNFDQLYEEILYAKNVTVSRNGKDTVIHLPEDLIGQLPSNSPFFIVDQPAVVDSIPPVNSVAHTVLKKHDRIMGVNGIATPYFENFKHRLDSLKGQAVTLTVIRDGQQISIPAIVPDSGKLGFIRDMPISPDSLESWGYYHYTRQHYGFFESFPAGVSRSGKMVRSYARQFKLIFNRKTGAYKKLGGFASMAKAFGEEWDWHDFWTMTAFLSIVLAFMNLLPIPGLDGGYVLFLLIEMITRRKVSDKVLEIANTIGLVLLLLLMVYANGNDIFKAFRGH